MATGKVMQATVEIAGNISPTLASSIKDATGKLDGLNVKALAVGVAAAGAAVAVGKAVIEAGEYLADLGAQFDDVEDTIRIGTGATGEALDGLLDSFDAVYSAVPTTMEDASKAIADYNTRLGVTDGVLEGLSVQAIQVADMLGEDLGGVIESSSQAMQNWNIDAESMGDAMDYVFKVSQSTGVGFTDLMSELQTYGAQLQEVGYSFEDAAALLGQVEKAGYDASTVFTALKTGAKNAADDGFESLTEGIASYIDQIKNAESETEAYAIATEVFGSKAASTMISAINDGTLSVEGLTAELLASSESINTAATDTYDFAEILQMLKQQGEIALKPLANAVFQMINDLMPVLSDAMEGVIPIIETLTDTLVPIVENIVPSILPLITEIVPVLLEMAGAIATELIPPIVEIMTELLPVALELLQMLLPVLTSVIADIMPVIVKLVKALLPVLLKIVSAVLPVITGLLETLLPLLGEIIDAVLPVVLELIDALLPLFMTIVDAVLPVIVDLLNTLTPILMDIISAVLPVVVQLIEALVPIITQLIEAVLPILIEVLNLLTPILDLIIQLLTPILDLFMTLLQPVLDLIFMALTPLIEVVGLLISSALEPVLPILTLVAEAITTVLGGAIEGIKPVIESLMTVFQGLIDFITGIFTGDWSKAWSGVVDVFGGLWDALVGLVKLPINAVIGLVNKAIGGLNSISCTIPEWVPFVGGQTFGINIPTIPMLATGGFTEGITIAGEAGTEAVISFDPAYHERNVEIWREAGQMLGAEPTYTAQAGKLLELDDFSLTEMADGGTYVVYYDFSGFTWSPQVDGSGGDSDDVMTRLKEHEAEFFDWLEEFVRMREVSCFG